MWREYRADMGAFRWNQETEKVESIPLGVQDREHERDALLLGVDDGIEEIESEDDE